MTHAVALLALVLAAPDVRGQGELEGTWWGGMDLPGEFVTVVLEISRESGDLTARFTRPSRGLVLPLEIVSPPPELVAHLYEEGELQSVLELGLADGLLRGTASQPARGRSAPLVFRRVHELETTELDLYVGDYTAESGERIRIDRLPMGTRHEALVCSWTQSLRERTLFAVEQGAFVAGPDFERPAPVVDRLRFEIDDRDRVTLFWTGADGIEQSCERIPIFVDEDRIAEYVEGQLRSTEAPSFSVGIVHGEELVYARSFGVENRETGKPATPDTLYQVASVTKVFTATLLTILRDEGSVALDDPVARFLPTDVALPSTGTTGDPEITLRHLVTHTSGLRPQPTNYVFEGRHNNDYTVAGLHEGLGQVSLMFPAGASFSYSNLGYVLLGHCMARATGSSYEALLKERILLPLGMNDSTVNFEASDLERLATHYWSDDPLTPTPPWHPGEIAAQGGLSSTVRDMAKFVSMCLRDERSNAGPLRGSSVREMQRPHVRRMDGDGWLGYAWFIDSLEGAGTILYHSGFTGGHSSYLALSPGLEVGVIVLTNFGFQPAVTVGQWMIAEAVRNAREQIVPTSLEARRYYEAGDWENAAWAYGVLLEIAPENASWQERRARAAAALGRR